MASNKKKFAKAKTKLKWWKARATMLGKLYRALDTPATHHTLSTFKTLDDENVEQAETIEMFADVFRLLLDDGVLVGEDSLYEHRVRLCLDHIDDRDYAPAIKEGSHPDNVSELNPYTSRDPLVWDRDGVRSDDTSMPVKIVGHNAEEGTYSVQDERVSGGPIHDDVPHHELRIYYRNPAPTPAPCPNGQVAIVPDKIKIGDPMTLADWQSPDKSTLIRGGIVTRNALAG